MTALPPKFEELLNAVERSAVHLEMRDGYSKTHHAYVAWSRGEAVDPRAVWPEWFPLVGRVVRTGGHVLRARIISEPVSEYVRFQYSVTSGLNLASGEQVRWLPRRHTSDIALPGNDFWLFDERIVMWNHFNGDGESTGYEVTDDLALVELCNAAFTSVWERAIPHESYEPA